MRSHRLHAVVFCAAMFHPIAAPAQETGKGGQPAVSWRYSLKSSALLARPPDDAGPFLERTLAAAFWRFRLEPEVRFDGPLAFDFALEQRIQVRSSTATGDAMLAPPGGHAPFRLAQLDWAVASSARSEWRAEIDRAAVRLRLPRLELTAGRQAIGWGRGALFGAIDVFAPFSPLEVDREWRRGVDAVRAELKLADRLSVDAVAALDRTRGGSIAAARMRGYARRLDLELVGGYRAGDDFAGAAASAAVGAMELHGDAALFRTGGVVVGKAVVGGSYRIPLGNGIFSCAEYHYSGFGTSPAGGIAASLADPRFRTRYLRGDTQILGRHAVAVLASYERSAAILASGQWLHSPSDGSGVLVPSLTYTLDDRWSALFSVYLPYGRGPRGGAGREFGASPSAVFVQLRLYR